VIRKQTGITLVELLVAMTIMTVISTMIIMSWSALQNSYSYTVKSSQARNIARDAVERMRREIRAMQPQTPGGISVVSAEPNELIFTTAYNDFQTDTSGEILRTRYAYEFNSSQRPAQWKIIRQRDTNNDNSFDRTIMVADNVANGVVPDAAHPTPVFEYTYVDANGVTQPPTSTVTGANLARIVQVQIRVITDVNPAHAPSYFDLVTTVRPRNVHVQD
jgi:type II secretory pathway pseudopilin PulG